MKNLRKLFSLILCVSLVLGTFAAGGMTASADTVYTVTLDPGEGSGEPIVYRSSDQTEFPNWQNSEDLHFYLEDDGRMGFSLDELYVPDSFTAPEGYEFDGWQGANHYNILNSTETVFTAKWRFVYDPNGARYSLSPSEYTIENSGYNDITCSFDSLYLGRVTDKVGPYQANAIVFYINAGTLTDGNGNSIPFLVDNSFHFGAEDRIDTGHSYSSQEETFIMSVWIDPEEYAAAAPGTYTGELVYDSEWRARSGVAGESGSIALTLVIPEPETVYTVTLDPGEGSGEPIVYRSCDQDEFTDWRHAENLHFYLEDDGRMAFRLNGDYCPDTFTAPDNYIFDRWSEDSNYHVLSSNDTVFTALWKEDATLLEPAYYSLSPSEYTIVNSGYTDITCSFDSLYLGKVNDYGVERKAEGLGIFINAGTLTDGKGNIIPFLVDEMYHFGPENRVSVGLRSSQDYPITMSLWINPEVYDAAAPGIYTGELVYDGGWYCGQENFISGESGSIALTLVIPEPSIEEPSITATISATEVVRGDKLTWNITTPADVTWLKFNGTDESGNAYTSYYKYSNYNKGTTEASVTDTDAGRVWNIPMVFNYAGTQAVDNQTWTIEYRVSGSNEWKSAPGEAFNIKVGKNAAALAPAHDGWSSPYMLIDAFYCTKEENGNTYNYFLVETSDDVSKIKISYVNAETGKTKSATYQLTSSNVIDKYYEDGAMVWTIRMKVTAPARNDEYTVQCRGPVWGEGEIASIIE